MFIEKNIVFRENVDLHCVFGEDIVDLHCVFGEDIVDLHCVFGEDIELMWKQA